MCVIHLLLNAQTTLSCLLAKHSNDCLTWYIDGHGSALNAGADGSSSLASESLDSDVIGSIRLQTLNGHLCFIGTVSVVVLAIDISIQHQVLDNLSIPLS